MLKYLHLILVVLVVISFVGRVVLAELKPEVSRRKWLRIAPHFLDTLLLLSGIGLIFHGDWLSAEYAWIIAKLIALLCFIGLGAVAMRMQGKIRWLAFAGALLCLIYIAGVALSKQALFFI
jgi:uncharacterized membrane protein SirB2